MTTLVTTLHYTSQGCNESLFKVKIILESVSSETVDVFMLVKDDKGAHLCTMHVRMNTFVDTLKCMLEFLQPKSKQELVILLNKDEKKTLHYSSQSGSPEALKYLYCIQWGIHPNQVGATKIKAGL